MSNRTLSEEESLRRFFKYFNNFMLLLWRLGFRRWVNLWPAVGGRILVITHTGRKSGLRRRTPVNYAIVDGDIYCTAGFGAISDWYRNILANPQVEIWLPDSWWAGVAEDVSQDVNRLPLLRQVIIASGMVGPMMGVNPRTMDDETFDRVTAEYRLIRIRLVRRLSGAGGPGDLALMWILVVLAGLLLVLFRRYSK